ncbi:hypothetical protein ABT063_24770 [Streptomyces sp. NPDC002838]|uniref:hypothetical protein n=1 Tax=Streptomyces sp. NPDC002838 TaxID=3154436 RepID=UPI00333480BC
MRKKTLPRLAGGGWAHPYGHTPFSPVLYADGSGGDGAGSGSGNPPAPANGDPTPPAPPSPPAPPASTPPAGGAEPDWKAEARKWEQRAKDNKGAVDELEKLKAAQMTEQEKAVAAAEKQGRTAALSEAAPQIAQARLEAAAARAGVDLSEFAEYLDVGKFIDKDGAVDDKAIKAAVDKFAKLAPPKGPGRSGGDLGGGSGDQGPTLDQQIAQAKADGNWRLAMRLENSKLAALTDQQ